MDGRPGEDHRVIAGDIPQALSLIPVDVVLAVAGQEPGFAELLQVVAAHRAGQVQRLGEHLAGDLEAQAMLGDEVDDPTEGPLLHRPPAAVIHPFTHEDDDLGEEISFGLDLREGTGRRDEHAECGAGIDVLLAICVGVHVASVHT
jgi:hypothetical protein